MIYFIQQFKNSSFFKRNNNRSILYIYIYYYRHILLIYIIIFYHRYDIIGVSKKIKAKIRHWTKHYHYHQNIISYTIRVHSNLQLLFFRDAFTIGT